MEVKVLIKSKSGEWFAAKSSFEKTKKLPVSQAGIEFFKENPTAYAVEFCIGSEELLLSGNSTTGYVRIERLG